MPKGLSRRQKQENQEMIGFYRDWMNRVRTKDQIQNLADLEAYARKRVDWLTHYCKPHPLLSEHSVKVFQALEQRERKLVEHFAFMKEKLGWVLTDMNEAAGITATRSTEVAIVTPQPSTSPARSSGKGESAR